MRPEQHLPAADAPLHDVIGLGVFAQDEDLCADHLEAPFAVKRNRSRVVSPDAEPDRPVVRGVRALYDGAHQVERDAAAVPSRGDIETLELDGILLGNAFRSSRAYELR